METQVKSVKLVKSEVKLKTKSEKVMKSFKRKAFKAKFMTIPLAVLMYFLSSLSFGQTPKIDKSQIQYWVGSGTDSAILIVNWCDENVAFAWGYCFNGSITVENMLVDMMTLDPRLYFDVQSGYVGSFSYLHTPCASLDYPDMPMYSVNTMVANVISAEYISADDIVEFGGYECGDISADWSTIEWDMPVTMVNDPNLPPPSYMIHSGFGDELAYQPFGAISFVGDSTVTQCDSITYFFTPNAGYHVGSVKLGGVEKIQDVVNNTYTVSNIVKNDTLWVLFAVDKNNTITKNDILYWVGQGNNEVIFAVNWCDPEEVSLAWGYRFSTNNVLVSKVIDDIKAADSRFDYIIENGYIVNVTYKDSLHDLSLSSGEFWAYNVNEVGADVYTSQYVYNNDIIECGGTSCGLLDDFWTNVWTNNINPVSPPTTTNIVSRQNSNFNVSVYPNPTNDYFYLSISGISGNISMKISDINGKILQSEDFELNDNGIKKISAASFSKGVYFIHLQNNNGTQTQKLIVY